MPTKITAQQGGNHVTHLGLYVTHTGPQSHTSIACLLQTEYQSLKAQWFGRVSKGHEMFSPWSGGHEFEPCLSQTWVAEYFYLSCTWKNYDRQWSCLAYNAVLFTCTESVTYSIWVIPARCRTSTSFANYAIAVKTLTLRQVFILIHWNNSISS